MRRATTLTLFALAAAGLLPGCLTVALWEATEGDPRAVSVAELTTWRRSPDEGFELEVLDSDGDPRTLTYVRRPGMPAELLEDRHRYGPTKWGAAADVRLAVRRGLVTRALAADRRFAHLLDEPDFQAAMAAPLVSPTFSLGPLQLDGSRELFLRGDDGVAVVIDDLDPLYLSERSAGGTVVAVLATPFTFVLDVATSPIEGIVILLLYVTFKDLLG